MKRLFSLIIVCALGFTFNTALAAETSPEAAVAEAEAEQMVAVTELLQNELSDEFACASICSSEGVKRAVRYYEVRDCKSISADRIKQVASRIADECCSRLKECCDAGGCKAFKCKWISYEWKCVSEHRLCISVAVEYSCQ